MLFASLLWAVMMSTVSSKRLVPVQYRVICSIVRFVLEYNSIYLYI